VKNRTAIFLGAMVVAILALDAAGGLAGADLASAGEQDKRREAQLRTVRGSVVNKDEHPLPSGIVYLKNLRTQDVRTHIADDEGRYRFSGLDPNVDYEIHAEKGDQVSARRTISNLDGRKEIVINLKVNKKKEAD